MVRALVSQREIINQYGGLSDSLEKEYVDYLNQNGITTFPVTNFGNIDDLLLLNWDMVVLTGGGVIAEDAYNYEREDVRQVHRDATENKLINYACEKGIPLIGICRGMQKINSFFGGKTSSFEKCPVKRDTKISHLVRVISSGEIIKVNHYHSDVLFVEDLSRELHAIAIDIENRTVEAFSGNGGQIIGIQWHPERNGNDEKANAYIKEIIPLFSVACN